MQEIHSDDAPQAIGPYSQGVKAGSFLFVSGQIPIDPKTGKMVGTDIGKQARQVLDNMEAVLTAGGTAMDHVVRVDIFLKDLKNDFSIVNEIYAERFNGSVKPARQTVEVSGLPLDVGIEMSCIAFVEEK
jgi:2-iminobutanoate/2-iminopropanoate deaminase